MPWQRGLPQQLSPYDSRFQPTTSAQNSRNSASLERIAMLEERFFAQDKLMSQQLLAQQKRLEQLEIRALGLESKFEEKVIGNVTERNSDITNAADSRHVQSSEEIRDEAGMLRVQSLEDQVKQLETCFRGLESVHISEELPKVIDRVSALEFSQESLKARENKIENEKPMNNHVQSLDTHAAIAWVQDLKKAPEYTLQPSVWDVLIFSFTAELGLSGSLFSSLLVVINSVAQACMLAVFTTNFLDPHFDSGHEQEAKAFRIDISHDYRFMDSLTQRSLAARICDTSAVHDLALELGQFQRQALNNIQSFLKDGGVDGFWFNGQIMCALALACWTAIVLEEFANIYDLAGAVALLPRRSGTRTHIGVHKSSDNSALLYIRNVSVGRTIAVLLSLCLRAVIASTLLYAGCRWLATTANIRDLLLNAVALQFILSLDEILYGTFSSSHTRAILESFAPFKRPHSLHVAGFEMRKVFLVLCMPLCVILFYQMFTAPMVDDMKKVRSALCDPPLDFVFGKDAFQFVHIGATGKDILKDTGTEIARFALQEALDTKGSTSLTGLKYSFDPLETSLSVADALSVPLYNLVDLYNRACRDILDLPQTSHTEIWFQFKKLFNASTCHELKDQCLEFSAWSGVMTRAFCPVTCGCGNPWSNLPAMSPQWGCPSACTKTDEYQGNLETASCINPTVSQLNSTTHWPHMLQFLFSTNDAPTLVLASAMAQYGCDFLNHMSGYTSAQNVCLGSTVSGLKPLAPICPQTCGCGKDSKSCEYGPTNTWCMCLLILDDLLQNKTPSQPEIMCEPLICCETWEDAQPFITSRYKELWHLGSDKRQFYCRYWDCSWR